MLYDSMNFVISNFMQKRLHSLLHAKYVLFIHGILGKPDYFDFLRPHIPAEGFHTEYILLEGHCDTPKGFGKASMAQWRS